MNLLFTGCGLVVLLGILMILIRALVGPTVFDRILAVNAMGTKAVVFMVLLGAVGGRGGYVDIALLYALMNYIATVAILKFLEFKRLG